MAEPPHVLVVDDDRRLRQLLQSYLAGNGFRVTAAASAAEARQRMAGVTFDLMILDIMMPGENGLQLAQSLRRADEQVPVLMLSALADTEDRIAGLGSGSDDYLSKPFEPRELVLRVRNLLRRAALPEPPVSDVRFGAFSFNLPRGELRKEGDPVRLTSREKDLLRLLASQAGRPVARTGLAQPGSEESARSVDVQINRLRQKIETDPAHPLFLLTVRGAGYALCLE